MADQISKVFNAYETTLDSLLTSGATSMVVVNAGAVAPLTYLCIDPEDNAKREYVLVTGVAGTTFTITRYLEGSAGGSIEHSAGAVVRSVALKQMWQDLHDRIDADFTAFDSHHGGNLVADHPEATAGARGFMPAGHIAAGGAVHANAVASGAAGFMTGADKALLDDLDQHQDRHQAGGADAQVGNLNATARVNIGVNAGITGARRHLSLLEGPGIVLTPTDQPGSERVDVEIELYPFGFLRGETVIFTVNDTFDKGDFPGIRAVRIHCVGGGGAGGGCSTTAAAQAAGGGGGGAGGYAQRFRLESALAASETVTIGAGGTGVSGGNGNPGGNTSLGTHCQANGGGGGVNGAAGAGQPGRGGDGGSGFAGDLFGKGGPGHTGHVSPAPAGYGGNGGDSWAGGGGITTADNSNGAIPGSFGGGGSGGNNNQSQGSARTGGAGGAGVVIVEVLY